MNAAIIPAFLVRNPLWIAPAAYLLGSIRVGGSSIDFRVGHDAAENFARRTALAIIAAKSLLNAAKGYFAVWLAAHFTQANIHWMMYAALCAILGDLFPVWFGFRGGRGVATAAGVFLGICWPAVALAFSVWLLVLWFWDYVSLASISAAAAFPMLMYTLYAPGHAPPEVVSFGTMLASALVIVRHSDSIQRLLAGTELRFSPRKPKNQPRE